MKHLKKIMALLIAVVMVLAMGVTVWADTTGSTVTGTKFTYEGTDATTNGNISVANATKDTTYTLFKIFDATYDATAPNKVAYTIKDGALKTELTKTAWNDYFTINTVADANGNFSVIRTGTTTNGSFTPTKTDAELIAALKDLDTALFAKVGAIKASANGKIEWDKIPYGYYMIVPDKPESSAVVSITTNNPEGKVIDKNNKPQFDKNIVIKAANAGDADTLQKWSESGLDIAVPFQIDLIGQNYDGEKVIFQYAVYDTLDDGFTLTKLPVVTINDSDTPAVLGTDYTVTYKTAADAEGALTVTDVASAATAQYFEIIIPWTDDGTANGNHLYDPNTTVKVEYEAKLDPEKADKIKVGNTANNNKADVMYWVDGDTPDKPTGDLPDRITKTWETSLTIKKTDENGDALVGAEFTLSSENGALVTYVYKSEYVEDAAGTYYKLKNGTYTDEAPNGNETHDADYEDKDKTYKKQTTAEVLRQGQNTNITAAVDPDGKVTFSCLGTGNYTLVESKVPDGFNKADDIEFTISFKMVDGFNPADVKDTDGKFSSNKENIVLDAENNVFNATVVNKPGQLLPATGGIGRRVFIISGSVLLLGAAILLITRRRMSVK